MLCAAVSWSSVDVGLMAPGATSRPALAIPASDVYGTSLQAGAWLSPKLLVKEQPSLGPGKAGTSTSIRGTGVHEACTGAIVITGALPLRLQCADQQGTCIFPSASQLAAVQQQAVCSSAAL